MRILTPVFLLLAAAPAMAAEVVWLSDASPAEAALVATAAGAARAPMDAVDLRAAGSSWTAADDAALEALSAALDAVRPYETRLDGELVIMRDLMRPIDTVGALRNQSDADAMFRALAYQGFAVNRYFGDTLDSDAAAADYRSLLEGLAVERPWVDAVAVQPGRAVTPYEIAEAPQRVAFSAVRARVLESLPGSLVPGELPSGAVVVIDGAVADIGPTGSIRVPPGRHLVHADLGGRIVGRWDLRLEPGDEVTLDVPLTDAALDGWLLGVKTGADVPVPEALWPSIDALGGEVWLAHSHDRGLQVWSVSANGVVSVPIDRPRTSGSDGGEDGPSAVLALHAGWLSSANFALDAPSGDFDFASVNTVTVGLDVGGAVPVVGPLVIGGGVHTVFTPGEEHVARYNGSSQTRLRPTLYGSLGVRQAQLLVGYTLPFHPTVGAKVAVPAGGVEIVGSAMWGLPTAPDRDSGPEYQSKSLYALSAGIGYRFD